MRQQSLTSRLAKKPKAPGAYSETAHRQRQPRVDEDTDSSEEEELAREVISKCSQSASAQEGHNQGNSLGARARNTAHSVATSGVVSTASEPGMELPGCMRGRYVKDPYFKKIFASLDQFPHFRNVDGLLYKVSDEETYQLCIPDILVGSCRLREVLLRHAHSVLAHLGTRKTLDYLRREVWWPEMVSDTGAYCRTCGVCATTKSATTRPMGLLKPMPVPCCP